jgi:hypothetical protein
MLEKSRPFISNTTRKESMELKSLKDNEKIKILHTEKGNCMVVLNESTYKEKITSRISGL